MSTSTQTEKSKSGRSATSCLECQRRKQKCSREWPCNHCQARKVPHLCQFASKKVATPENLSPTGPPTTSRKRKEESFEAGEAGLVDDPVHDLSDGFAKLGYMPGHDFFALAKAGSSSPNGCTSQPVAVQTEEIETALKTILPKPYTDVLVQNFLENANYQYYPIFPEQLRGQSAKWWEARAGGLRLSLELTCLLIRVCAVSAQYLEDTLKQRLELELGEKAQAMTERFHAAAKKLSSSIPRGSGGVVQVQQLFLEASWWKSEANMVESWHSLSMAIREAQEIGMHKPNKSLPHFELELRKRLWCVLWTWDWQMSTLLSRPLLIDQDDHKLEVPDGRLENITDPAVPHPLSAVALQATLGLHVSPLFQKMATNTSTQLMLEIEATVEKWMSSFPAALRDHRPDTRWDTKYPNVPFMRCQINVIAYCYLLAPLKPFLLGIADEETMKTQLGVDLRVKGVDTCLDLMRAAERFYDLIFPQSIKYFFIIFFMFDAATVMCSAIVHDVNYDLPKRGQCIRSLRTAQELMDGVAHLSESARISGRLLRTLTATLPLSPAERQILGVSAGAGAAHQGPGSGCGTGSKKIKTDPSPPPGVLGIDVNREAKYSSHNNNINSGSSISSSSGNSLSASNEFGNSVGGAGVGIVEPVPASPARTSSLPSSAGLAPYDLHSQQLPHQQHLPPPLPQQQQQQQHQQPYPTTQGYQSMQMPPTTTTGLGEGWSSGFGDFDLTPVTTGAGMEYVGGVSAGGVGAGTAGVVTTVGGAGVGVGASQGMGAPAQLGDPLTGTYLDPLWDWDRLNMDLSPYSMPQYGL